MPTFKGFQKKTPYQRGYRSGLEDKVAEQIKSKGLKVQYETEKIKYTDAEKTYTPDFKLPNGIIVETKGYFIPKDRSKHLRVKKQHPHLEIRFVFTNPNAKLNKTSQTTYAKWCEKHGFKYAKGLIPDDWFTEEL